MTTTPASLSPSQVTSQVESEQKGYMPLLPIAFIPILGFTTFSAELAVTEGDLVFHFYVTDEVNAGANPQKYWHELFPEVLQKTAQEYFKADYPRLKAAYTEEKASWWMRAFGFGLVLDPHKLAYRFFDALDVALDAAIASAK